MTRASDLARLMGAGGSLSGALSVDTISEKTSGSGVTIDSLNIKDSGIGGHQIGGRRNLFYNGNFQCWQRSTSETGLGASSGYFTADRWKTDIGATSTGRFTMNRTAGDPDGFNYGLVINCTTTDTSIAAGEFLLVQQRFEGQDLQHLKKGTSGAETTILSFYAKVAGSATDIVVEVFDNDNSRHICKKFTLTTDWVRYYFTIPGDTTGSLDQDTAQSMTVSFCLHSGSTYTGGTLATDWAANNNSNRFVGVDSIFASTSNEFYLAGVQWEVGSQATPFEHRSFDEERSLCQRYFQVLFESVDANHYTGLVAGRWSTNTAYYSIPLHKIMRAEPSMTVLDKDGTASSGPAGNLQGNGSNDDYTAGNMTLQSGKDGTTTISIGLDFNPTANYAYVAYFGNGEKINFDAEL